MIYPIPTYIFNWYIFQKCTFSNPAPEGRTETPNLHSSPKCWHDISNTNIFIQLIYISPDIYSTNIYFSKYIFLHLAPKGRTETLQLTFIPQVLAWYINTKLYIQLTYIPQIVGSIYAILMYHCMGTEAVSVYLQLRIYSSDICEYLLWGPVLFRNHYWQIMFQYIWVYMPSADCTLLRSRGGGGGAIFLKVHLPKKCFTKTKTKQHIFHFLYQLLCIFPFHCRYAKCQHIVMYPKFSRLKSCRIWNWRKRERGGWWTNFLE